MRSAIKSKGNWTNTRLMLNRFKYLKYDEALKYVGEAGVIALKEATPVRTGKTADSWVYKIKMEDNGGLSVSFENTNVVNGENVALLIEHGHGTKTGQFVPARPFINEALKPIISDFLDDIMEVKHAKRNR